MYQKNDFARVDMYIPFEFGLFIGYTFSPFRFNIINEELFLQGEFLNREAISRKIL